MIININTYLNDLSIFLKFAISFGGMCGIVAVVYRFFTTERIRKLHHRKLRVFFYLTHKTSWFKQAKKSSKLVLNFLNFIYGKPKNEHNLLTYNYFNSRSWKASFTIALFYIIGFVLLFYSIAGTRGEIDDIIQYYPSNLLIFLITFSSFAFLYFTTEKVSKKYKKNRENIDIYSLYIKIIFLFAIFSFILNRTTIGFIFIFWLLLLPLWLIWKYGPFGIKFYFIAIFYYNIMCIPYEIISSHNYLNISGAWGDALRIVYTFLIFRILSLISSKFDINSKKIVLVSFISNFCLIKVLFNSISTVTISSSQNINENLVLLILWLIVTGYMFFLAWGIIAANSIADLFSSNITRWLFAKIQNYSKWRHIISAAIVDVLLGISLISLVAFLFLSILSISYPLLNHDSTISFLNLEKQINKEENTSTLLSEELTIAPFLSGLIGSLIVLPTFFVNYDTEDFFAEYSPFSLDYHEESATVLIFIYWFFYLSVLIPSLMHFFCILLLFFTKIISDLIQNPAIYLHKLLIESPTEDNFFGKAFSGVSRGTGIISIIGTLTIIFLYIILKLIMQAIF